MSIDKPFLLGTNWKMNKMETEAVDYTKDLIKMARLHKNLQFFFFPPFIYIKELRAMLEGEKNILIGAQNMHWEDYGPYTGEISPKMLAQYNINIIELGHSERRQHYNENNIDLNKKVLSAISHGFIALLCIGETDVDKKFNVVREVLKLQTKIGLHGVSASDIEKVWIAYEPVWAIGENGVPAKAEYASKAHTYIREQLTELFGEEVAQKNKYFVRRKCKC